jgi:hypothetical protein
MRFGRGWWLPGASRTKYSSTGSFSQFTKQKAHWPKRLRENSVVDDKRSGAPSFAFSAKGGISRMCGEGPRVKSSGIPPFANSAKDGTPDPLWQGKQYP